jgi:hypothetical protein
MRISLVFFFLFCGDPVFLLFRRRLMLSREKEEHQQHTKKILRETIREKDVKEYQRMVSLSAGASYTRRPINIIFHGIPLFLFFRWQVKKIYREILTKKEYITGISYAVYDPAFFLFNYLYTNKYNNISSRAVPAAAIDSLLNGPASR